MVCTFPSSLLRRCDSWNCTRSSKKRPEGVLSDEEYSIVTSTDEESDIPIKIKFKIVELFQDSKIKLAGAFSKLFSLDG